MVDADIKTYGGWMTPLELVQGIPTLHWLLLAGAGWLLMFACFVGWHLERRPHEPRRANDAIFAVREPEAAQKRRAA